MDLCCWTLAKHRFFTETFGMEFIMTDLQSSEAGWIGLQWYPLVLKAVVMDLGAA